ncbi:hypothetical protein LTR35_016344 [Friedmanniomyces endolithicus]|uniref:BTB domain-containing protein n=1 Tax=Friedmanniomyces endolithicus TaxID=329885 RepID=A0AAN6FZJ4_9PEZI|nr:hypothetical protein LTR35_016344 [Friedmanniomyces endolithicus]KAK0326349.1 hypothetical protein LTR82_002189 [Friedmanniomyces endolithicus]KAK0976773.1 hypothetical protein LTR54_016400 [Friedmanniomyces endolithicus]
MAATEVVDIAPHGDVLLQCGKQVGKGKILGLRVSSHIMSHGSPVFKALLAPKFKEGTTLATSSTVQVPLPEDHPEYMEVLCKIFHLRNDLGDRFEYIDLEEFAKLCESELRQVRLRSGQNDIMFSEYFGAAMTLRCADAAKRTATAFVYQTTSAAGIAELVRPGGSTLGAKYAMVHQAVCAAHLGISNYIDFFIDEQHNNRGVNGFCDAECTVSTRRVSSLLTQLKEAELWSSTTKGRTLEDLLRSMESLILHEPINMSACKLPGEHCAKALNPLGSEKWVFWEAASRIREMVEAMDFRELVDGS